LENNSPFVCDIQNIINKVDIGYTELRVQEIVFKYDTTAKGILDKDIFYIPKHRVNCHELIDV